MLERIKRRGFLRLAAAAPLVALALKSDGSRQASAQSGFCRIPDAYCTGTDINGNPACPIHCRLFCGPRNSAYRLNCPVCDEHCPVA